jgi:hypothetical protein
MRDIGEAESKRQKLRLDPIVYTPPMREKHTCYPRTMAPGAFLPHALLLSPLGVTAILTASALELPPHVACWCIADEKRAPTRDLRMSV